MKNLFKKILLIFSIVGIMSITTTSYAFADCDHSFLGLSPWNCGVGDINSEETLKKGIWVIASNVATDIAIIAAYLVLGYVIYGGYLYTFSGGDPGKVASGKKTLAQAFIGLAIVMSANLIMGSIRIALVGGSGNIGNCATGVDACVTTTDLVNNLVNWFTAIAGVASAIFLVYGGISYMTSAGDPGKVQKAKQMILYSLIGLAIVALAVVITAFVSSTIRNANNTAYLINQTIILKGGK
ncbi:hypothetical protein J6V85_01130 [Candidatus Saccharibacteria bacterium]|nr:hypothetical protein [Candidatus Saccharibacteria bacterium]